MVLKPARRGLISDNNHKRCILLMNFFNENVPFTLRLKIISVLKLICEKLNNPIFTFRKTTKPNT